MVVGGDGSILGVAREFVSFGIPVLGINRGGLGFLANISPDEIQTQLTKVLAGEYQTEEHFLVQQTVYRKGHVVHESLALNDVVVSSGSLSRMMNFKLSINDEFVYELRADGLLISTPTGSTAYSLSAGGPIMHPHMDALSIIPLYPHTLASRQIVVPGSSTLQIRTREEESGARTSSDSQIEFELIQDDTVEIKKHPKQLHLVYAESHNFYEACRSKLDWGSRLGLKNV